MRNKSEPTSNLTESTDDWLLKHYQERIDYYQSLLDREREKDNPWLPTIAHLEEFIQEYKDKLLIKKQKDV